MEPMTWNLKKMLIIGSILFFYEVLRIKKLDIKNKENATPIIVIIFVMIKVLGIIEFIMVVTKYIRAVNSAIITISPIGKDNSITCPI